MKATYIINYRELVNQVQFHLGMCQDIDDIIGCCQFFNDYLENFSDEDRQIIINAMN